MSGGRRAEGGAGCALVLLAAALAVAGCSRPSAKDGGALRLGFFPNVTHAQALVAHHEGLFRQALGTTPLEVKLFNAGPAAMESLLAGEVDVAYVGAGPALIAYVRSEGRIRVVSGAASGGALLVTKGITDPQCLHGALIATPQIGNTQDIALRHWLRRVGLLSSDRGGDVRVTPLGNPEILNLFRRGELQGAWVPEPWASRLLTEGGGTILVDERDLWPDGRFPTTVIVASTDALLNRRKELSAILRVHRELTLRAKQDPAAFLEATDAGYQFLTGKRLPAEVMKQAFSRIELTTDPLADALKTTAQHARDIGYLPARDISGIVDASILHELEATTAER